MGNGSDRRRPVRDTPSNKEIEWLNSLLSEQYMVMQDEDDKSFRVMRICPKEMLHVLELH